MGTRMVQTRDLYAETLAWSLVLYAQISIDFKLGLLELIRKAGLKNSGAPIELPAGARALIPEDDLSALRKAEWLLTMLREKNIPGYLQAAELLSMFAEKEWESPKQIVVGVIVVAIPGITMGKFFLKKKKMALIMRKDLSFNAEVVQKISETTHHVVLKSLSFSKGNVNKLEPETRDWFLGDRQLVFYKSGANEISRMEKELQGLGIICSSSPDEKGHAVLAVSPEVNGSYFEGLQLI